ncbi:MAG: 2-polyprenyl-3-methyl-6-methoxy-1,4-benzoquinone monooxygenase [Betaproteobacteria bacterium]|nr:2-polyprenyl-3-methyl-6-methoxy-1,4-benzoquinone monooxygenase [Betaproteobacteria bacterium]
MLDRLIGEFDRALRTVAGVHQAARENPAAKIADVELRPDERRRAAALMRVNHVGEVCAQALYQGQALASREEATKHALARAAAEEEDHLAWSQQRIEELGGRASLLNPVWYAGALAIGYAAGRCGDAVNLGFLAETELQVAQHLEGHLARLSPQDGRTRAVVDAMRMDEAAHAATAQRLGASELPLLVKFGMRAAARVMTTTAYWI